MYFSIDSTNLCKVHEGWPFLYLLKVLYFYIRLVEIIFILNTSNGFYYWNGHFKLYNTEMPEFTTKKIVKIFFSCSVHVQKTNNLLVFFFCICLFPIAYKECTCIWKFLIITNTSRLIPIIISYLHGHELSFIKYEIYHVYVYYYFLTH